MTPPDTPQDPQTGKVPDDAGQTAEAAKTSAQEASVEAAAEQAAQPAPADSEPREAGAAATEGTAAAQTGIDKTAAAAAARAADAPAGAEESGHEGPTAAEVEAEASRAAAQSQPAGKDALKSSAKDAPAPPAKRGRGRGRRGAGAGNGRAAEPVLVRAKARYVRTSPRKARLVCDHIRGKDVAEARAILAFTPRGAAKAWIKLLESAVANAEHNHELVGDELRIFSVYADEGPTLKRFRPRAMGRATRIRKRTSHLTITLTPKES